MALPVQDVHVSAVDKERLKLTVTGSSPSTSFFLAFLTLKSSFLIVSSRDASSKPSLSSRA
jgi:hypothetical protein